MMKGKLLPNGIQVLWGYHKFMKYRIKTITEIRKDGTKITTYIPQKRVTLFSCKWLSFIGYWKWLHITHQMDTAEYYIREAKHNDYYKDLEKIIKKEVSYIPAD